VKQVFLSTANGKKFMEQAVASYAQAMLPNLPIMSLPADIQQSIMVAIWFEILQYVFARKMNLKDFLVSAGSEYLALKTYPYLGGYLPAPLN
jgi:hypothetical protein